MGFSPRYDGRPVIEIEVDLDLDVVAPAARQRARLGDLLATLDDDQWATPSRCEGWSVQDVVSHLVTVNQFWTLSIQAGLAGQPTRYLVDFDPVDTPAQLVDGARGQAPAQTLDAYRGGADGLTALLDGLDDQQWELLAEAPPGHLPIRLVVLHGLWDSWIHERDIALPLGLAPAEEGDEIAGALAYVAALGPAFDALSGSARAGTLEIRAEDPVIQLAVDHGPTVVVHGGPATGATPVLLTGPAVELAEALSFRGPFPEPLAESDRWALGSLGVVFGQSR